jgi:predicted SprT family Zn-dependent metalloprotease
MTHTSHTFTSTEEYTEPHYSCNVCGTNVTEKEFETFKNADGTMDCQDCDDGKISEVEA